MSMLEQTAAQYRSLHLSAIARELNQLLVEAEAGEMSYLNFASRMAAYDATTRRLAFLHRSFWKALTTATRPQSASARLTHCWTSSLSTNVTT
ncbi:hypothetical protein [Nitrosomonas sp.]|uniref:hypothetical protein n=1 Tax=Nitrosomonas sp. TaxID=42353 RepID=UPI0025F01FF8|nr:hypothetical protein [Nitrosomonas sp.]